MLLNSYTFLLIFLPVVVVLYWLVPRGYPRHAVPHRRVARLLRAVGLAVHPAAARDHARRLGRRPLSREERGGGREPPPQADPGGGRRHQPRVPRLLQVPRLLRRLARRHPAADRGRRAAAGAQSCCCRSASASTPSPASRTPWTSTAAWSSRRRASIHYLAWVTLFPYILAGPIIRYGHVGAQLERAQQRFRWALIGTGLFFLVMGFAKKMLVADMMAPYVERAVRAPRPPRAPGRAGRPPSATRCSSTSTSPATATWPWASPS